MSRIGIGRNVQQPQKKCFGCKFWQSAGKDYLGFSRSGNCTTGYCKKDIISTKQRGKK